MTGAEQLAAFLAKVRSDAELQQQLATFHVELWGDAHLPLDIDLDAVIALASEIGFHFDRADVVASQCSHLERFAAFEIENAIVARRYLARIQLQVDRGGKPEEPLSYYRR
ncbi:Nif11-like leader peptide family natural product precursor [Synechococcus sp. GEYO]|uniref:Nif11-like leader peptide family natural product precursor n=1 Tax=Synechococcus sp. GEYO TaxID=2575511 RepID=UPI0014833B2E|nr:Nif11-like leader peptide family natural product precursor [Synechococcus sp. GEYO]